MSITRVSSPGCLRSSLPNVALIYMALNGGSGAPPKLDRGFASSATSDPAVAKACAAGGFLGTNPTDHGWSLSGFDFERLRGQNHRWSLGEDPKRTCRSQRHVRGFL